MFTSRKLKIKRLMVILENESLTAAEIIQKAKKLYGIFHGLGTASLYTLLASLESSGKIRSFWTGDQYPRKRKYSKAESG